MIIINQPSTTSYALLRHDLVKALTNTDLRHVCVEDSRSALETRLLL